MGQERALNTEIVYFISSKTLCTSELDSRCINKRGIALAAPMSGATAHLESTVVCVLRAAFRGTGCTTAARRPCKRYRSRKRWVPATRRSEYKEGRDTGETYGPARATATSTKRMTKTSAYACSRGGGGRRMGGAGRSGDGTLAIVQSASASPPGRLQSGSSPSTPGA